MGSFFVRQCFYTFYVLCILCKKDIGTKAACEMFEKLTTGREKTQGLSMASHRHTDRHAHGGPHLHDPLLPLRRQKTDVSVRKQCHPYIRHKRD